MWRSDGSSALRQMLAFSIFLMLAIAPVLTTEPASAPPPPPNIYRKAYTIEGSFLEPVIGPSSPQNPSRNDGRLWFIFTHDTGLIEMDYITAEDSSFDNPAPALSFRIQDYGLDTPISNIVYVVPGKSTLGQYEPNDDLSKNGLLGFVANGRLVLFDPYTKGIPLYWNLGFQPRWFSQDVISAGETFESPMRVCYDRLVCECNRFFVAANDTHVSVIKVNYRSSQDSPQIPSGSAKEVLSVNMSVVAAPLAYHLPLRVNRSGIFVPTSNNLLAAFSIDGQHRTDIPLELDGEQAEISAPIGYSRSSDDQTLYIPLKSASKTGVVYLKLIDLALGSVSATRTIVIDEPALRVTFQPDPANTGYPFFVVTSYPGGVAMSSQILRGTDSDAWVQAVWGNLTSPATDFFYSPTTSQVVALDRNGTLWEALDHEEWKLTEFPQAIHLGIRPNETRLFYAGSRGGAKYSTIASRSEMIGMLFRPQSGNTTIFLLGEQWYPPPGPNGGTFSTLGAVILVAASATVVAIAVVVALTTTSRRSPPHPPPRSGF